MSLGTLHGAQTRLRNALMRPTTFSITLKQGRCFRLCFSSASLPEGHVAVAPFAVECKSNNINMNTVNKNNGARTPSSDSQALRLCEALLLQALLTLAVRLYALFCASLACARLFAKTHVILKVLHCCFAKNVSSLRVPQLFVQTHKSSLGFKACCAKTQVFKRFSYKTCVFI